MFDALWWTNVFLPWFILFAGIYVFLDVLYTFAISVIAFLSIDKTNNEPLSSLYDDTEFIKEYVKSMPVEERRRVKINETLSLKAMLKFNNQKFKNIGIHKRSIQNDLLSKIRIELQSRSNYQEFKQQRGLVCISRIFDSFLSLLVSGFTVLLLLIYYLSALIFIFGFVYVFYLYYPWVLGNAVLLWNDKVGPFWNDNIAILFNLSETVFSAYVAVYNLVVWSVINAPLKVLTLMLSDGLQDVVDFGSNGASFFKQTFTDLRDFVSTVNDYNNCTDVEDMRCYQTVPLNIQSGMVHGRLAVSAAARFFTRSCTVISPAVNILVYPLLDPNTGIAIQALLNSVTSSVQAIMLTQRRQKLPVPVSTFFKLPDLEPIFSSLITASTHIGYTIDNWLDMTYFLSWQYYKPSDITSCLNDRTYQNILFGTNHSSLFGKNRTTIVSLTPELFAFTDGVHVEYHLYKQNLKIYESYNAWDIPINVSYGVAAVSYATNTFQDEFASGDTTSMLGCQCSDNATTGEMVILCDIATYDPSGQISGFKLVPVEWEVKDTPKRMSCKQTKIQVESVRWPTKRFTKPFDYDLYTLGGQQSPPTCYDTQTCSSVDAVVWIMPLCDTGSSSVTPALKTACIRNFIDFSCFPYCFALRTKNSGTEKLVIRSSKTWDNHVFLQKRDCILQAVNQSDKGLVSSSYKVTTFGSNPPGDAQFAMQYVDYPAENYQVTKLTLTSTPSCVYSDSAITQIPKNALDSYSASLNNTQQINDMANSYSYQDASAVYFDSSVNYIKLNLQPLVFGGSMGMRRIEICENPTSATQCLDATCDVFCESSIDFFRISGNEYNEFTLDYLMQGGTPIVQGATTAQSSTIMTSSSLLPPPSSLQSAFIDNPGVSTYDRFWYAVNPNYKSVECLAKYCQFGDNCFNFIILSDLDTIRIWRVNPYAVCPINSNGEKQCPIGTFSSVYLNKSKSLLKDLNVDQSLCFQNETKDLFVEQMEYFDELNVVAVVRRGTIQDLYRLLWTNGGQASAPKTSQDEFKYYVQNHLETVYYFINTQTMEISENVPWMVVPTSVDTDIPICPQFRTIPRLGSLASELNNAALHLLKKTLNLILNSPSLLVIWSTPKQDRCLIPSYGHSIYSNCGRDYFDITAFFTSLYNANTHLWSILTWFSGLIPTNLDWPVSETGLYTKQLLQGMAIYKENTKYVVANDLTNALVITADSQMQDFVFENTGGTSSSFSGMVFNLGSLRTAVGMHLTVTPVAYAHAAFVVLYPMADEIFSSFYQQQLQVNSGLGMFLNHIFYSHRLEIMDIIFVRHEQACYGISLIAGANTPLGELLLKWCLAGGEFQRSILDLFFSIFVELPSMNCICTMTQGADLNTALFGDDQTLGCLDTAADEFKPQILNMLYVDEIYSAEGVYLGGARSTFALSQMCNNLQNLVAVRFFETFNVWAEHSYQASNALADTIEYLTVFFYQIYSGGTFLQRQKACVNYVSNPFASVIYPMPLDYFRICGKTSTCRLKCNAEFALFDEELQALGGSSGALIAPTSTPVKISSPIFTTWDEYYNLDVYPLSISEMNPIDQACSGCNNDVNSKERCFAVVGVPIQSDTLNTYGLKDALVKIFCVPKSLQKTIHISHAWTLSTSTHQTQDFVKLEDIDNRRILRAGFSKPYSHYVITLQQQNVPVVTSINSPTQETIVAWTYDVLTSTSRSATVASNAWISLQCSSIILDEVAPRLDIPIDQIEKSLSYVNIVDFFTVPSTRYDISLVVFLKVNVRQYQVKSINGEQFVYDQSETVATVHIGWCDLSIGNSDKTECNKVSRGESTCERLDMQNMIDLRSKLDTGNMIYVPTMTKFLWVPIYQESKSLLFMQNVSFVEGTSDVLKFEFNDSATSMPLSVNDKGTRMLLTSRSYFDVVRYQTNAKYYSYVMTTKISETSAWILESGEFLPTWFFINTGMSRGPWLEITDYNPETFVLTSRNTEVVTATLTRQYQCDGNNCEGCDTSKSLKLKTFCSSVQNCVFEKCIGTLVNTGNLFCNIGLTMKAYYDSVISMLISIWYALSETVTLVIANKYLPAGSAVSIKINWPTDIIYIFVCETKDFIAQASSVIASLVNLNVSPENYADMELMSRGYSTFQSYTSMRASSIHQIVYHFGLFPLYALQALHKWILCTTNDAVNVFENDIFRLEIGDLSTLKVGLNSNDPYAPGICLSQYYTELGLSSENSDEQLFANSVAQEFSSLNGITSFAGALALNNFGLSGISADLQDLKSTTSNQLSRLETKTYFLDQQAAQNANAQADTTVSKTKKSNQMFYTRVMDLVTTPVRVYTDVKMNVKSGYQRGRRLAKYANRFFLNSFVMSAASLSKKVGSFTAKKLSSMGPLELLIHGFDSFFAWSKGVNTAFQDLAYVNEMSSCQANDVSTTSIIRCACGDEPVLMQANRRSLKWDNFGYFCSGTLLMPLKNEQVAIIFNPYSMQELSDLLYNDIQDYLNCLKSYNTDPNLDCSTQEPELTVFTSQNVSSMAVWTRCKSNYATMQWDEGTKALYSDDAPFTVSNEITKTYISAIRGEIIETTRIFDQALLDCLQDASTTTNPVSECLDIYLRYFQSENVSIREGIRKPTYFAYTADDNLNQEADACKLFSGPANSSLSRIQDMYKPCVDDTDGRQCKMNMLSWIGSSTNKVPIGVVHREILSKDKDYRALLVESKYNQLLNQINVAFNEYDKTGSDDLKAIDVSVFSAEGDMLHQLFDCIFLGPYSNVNYLAGDNNIDKVLQTLSWNRDDMGVTRDFTTPCAGNVLYETTENRGAPFTCGSPARRSVIKTFVRDVLISNTTAAGHVVNLVNQKILELRQSWTDVTLYGCYDSTKNTTTYLNCEDPLLSPGAIGFDPHLPDFGQISSDVIASYLSDLIEPYYKTVMTSTYPWNKYYRDTKQTTLWGQWRNDPASAVSAERIQAFDTQDYLASYNRSENYQNIDHSSVDQALKTLDMRRDEIAQSIWGVCTGLLSQVMMTIPLLKYNDTEETWAPKFTRVQKNEFNPNVEDIELWVERLLEEAFLNSPLYSTHVSRHVPSFSKVCIENSKSFEELDDKAESVPILPLHFIANRYNQTPEQETIVKTSQDESFSFYGFNSWSINEVFERCPCSTKNVTAMTCALSLENCEIIVQHSFTITETDSDQHRSAVFLRDVCSSGERSFKSTQIREIIAAFYTSQAPVRCAEMTPSDMWGFVDPESLVDEELSYTVTFKPPVDESSITMPDCPCSQSYKQPIYIYNYTSNGNESWTLANLIETGNFEDRCRLQQDVCDLTISLYDTTPSNSIVFEDIKALHRICVYENKSYPIQNSSDVFKYMQWARINASCIQLNDTFIVKEESRVSKKEGAWKNGGFVPLSNLVMEGRAGVKITNYKIVNNTFHALINPSIRLVNLSESKTFAQDRCFDVNDVENKDIASNFDDIIFKLFPVAQGVHDSLAYSTCTRYVIEMTRYKFYETIMYDGINEQEDVMMLWRDRCEHKVKQMSICHLHDVFDIVPDDWKLLSHDCPFDVERLEILAKNHPFMTNLYVTGGCLIYLNGTLYDGVRCFSELSQSRFPGGLDDVLNAPASCIVNPKLLSSGDNLVEQVELDVSALGESLKDFKEIWSQLKNNVTLSYIPYDMSVAFITDVFETSTTLRQDNAPKANCVENGNPLICKQSLHCDKIIDWWPEDWKYPIGYHVTLPCELNNTAHKTFDTHFTSFESSNNQDWTYENFHYVHTALRDNKKFFSHFGASGLCRLHTVGMPLVETNTNRFCTKEKISSFIATPQLYTGLYDNTQSFQQSEYESSEYCSTTSSQVPWSYESSDNVLNNVAGSIPLLLALTKQDSLDVTLRRYLDVCFPPTGLDASTCTSFDPGLSKLIFEILPYAGLFDSKDESLAGWGSCLPEWGIGKSCSKNDTICPTHTTCNIDDDPVEGRCITKADLVFENATNDYKTIPCIADSDCHSTDLECLSDGVCGKRINKGRMACSTSNSCPETQFCLPDGYCGYMHFHFMNIYEDKSVEFTIMAEDCGYTTENVEQTSSKSSPYGIVPDILQKHGFCAHRHWYSYRKAVNMLYPKVNDSTFQESLIDYSNPEHTWPYIQRSGSNNQLDAPNGLLPMNDTLLQTNPHPCDRKFLHDSKMKICSSVTGFDEKVILSNNEAYLVDVVENSLMFKGYQIKTRNTPISNFDKADWVSYWPRTAVKTDLKKAVIFNGLVHEQEKAYYESKQFSEIKPSPMGFAGGNPYDVGSVSRDLNDNLISYRRCSDLPYCGVPDFTVQGLPVSSRLVLQDLYLQSEKPFRSYNESDLRRCFSIGYIVTVNQYEYCAVDGVIVPVLMTVLEADNSPNSCQDIMNPVIHFVKTMDPFAPLPPPSFFDTNTESLLCYNNFIPLSSPLCFFKADLQEMQFSVIADNINRLSTFQDFTLDSFEASSKETRYISISRCAEKVRKTTYSHFEKFELWNLYQNSTNIRPENRRISAIYHVLSYHTYEFPLLWWTKFLVQTKVLKNSITLTNQYINLGNIWSRRFNTDETQDCMNELSGQQWLNYIGCINGFPISASADVNLKITQFNSNLKDYYKEFVNAELNRNQTLSTFFDSVPNYYSTSSAKLNQMYADGINSKYNQIFVYILNLLTDVYKSGNSANVMNSVIGDLSSIMMQIDDQIKSEIFKADLASVLGSTGSGKKLSQKIEAFTRCVDGIRQNDLWLQKLKDGFSAPVYMIDYSNIEDCVESTIMEQQQISSMELRQQSSCSFPVTINKTNVPYAFDYNEDEYIRHREAWTVDPPIVNFMFTSQVCTMDGLYRCNQLPGYKLDVCNNKRSTVSLHGKNIVTRKPFNLVQEGIDVCEIGLDCQYPRSDNMKYVLQMNHGKMLCKNYSLSCQRTCDHLGNCKNTPVRYNNISCKVNTDETGDYKTCVRPPYTQDTNEKCSILASGDIHSSTEFIYAQDYINYYQQIDIKKSTPLCRKNADGYDMIELGCQESCQRVPETILIKDTEELQDYIDQSLEGGFLCGRLYKASKKPSEYHSFPTSSEPDTFDKFVVDSYQAINTDATINSAADYFSSDTSRVESCHVKQATIPPGVAAKFYTLDETHDSIKDKISSAQDQELPMWANCPIPNFNSGDVSIPESDIEFTLPKKSKRKYYNAVDIKDHTLLTTDDREIGYEQIWSTKYWRFDSTVREPNSPYSKCVSGSNEDGDLKKNTPCNAACHYTLALSNNAHCSKDISDYSQNMLLRAKENRGVTSCNSGKRVFKMTMTNKRDDADMLNMYQCRQCLSFSDIVVSGRMSHFYTDNSSIITQTKVREIVKQIATSIYQNETIYQSLIDYMNSKSLSDTPVFESKRSRISPDIFVKLKTFSFTNDFLQWGVSDQNHVCRPSSLSNVNSLVEDINMNCNFETFNLSFVLDRDNYYKNNPIALNCPSEMPTASDYRKCNDEVYGYSRKKLSNFVEKVYKEKNGLWMHVIPPMTAVKWKENRRRVNGRFTMFFADKERPLIQKYTDYVLSDKICELGNKQYSMCLLYNNKNLVVNPWTAGEWHAYMRADFCERGGVNSKEICCSCTPQTECCYPNKRYCSQSDNIIDFIFEKENQALTSSDGQSTCSSANSRYSISDEIPKQDYIMDYNPIDICKLKPVIPSSCQHNQGLLGGANPNVDSQVTFEELQKGSTPKTGTQKILSSDNSVWTGGSFLLDSIESSSELLSSYLSMDGLCLYPAHVVYGLSRQKQNISKNENLILKVHSMQFLENGGVLKPEFDTFDTRSFLGIIDQFSKESEYIQSLYPQLNSSAYADAARTKNNNPSAWDCPLRKIDFWTKNFSNFRPLYPDPVRTDQFFRNCSCDQTSSQCFRGVHPMQGPQQVKHLQKLHTHLGKCMFSMKNILSNAWDDKSNDCSFLSDVKHLVSGEYSKSHAMKNGKDSHKICYDVLDWPAMGGPLRNGEYLTDASQHECDISERLNPFLLRWKNDAPLQLHKDGETTLDTGGDCHVGRVAYMSNEAWIDINSKYELCATIDTNVSHITVLCNGYRCDGECSLYDKLSLHSKKIYLRRKRRKNPIDTLWKGQPKRDCHMCDSGNVKYQLSQQNEISYGLYKRFPALAQLKKELSNALQKSNSIKNTDFDQWNSLLLYNLWKSPHKLTLDSVANPKTVFDIQNERNLLKQSYDYDEAIWERQHQWVYQSGNNRLGSMSKQTWKKDKVKTCDASLKFQTRNFNSNDLVKGIDICTLTSSLKTLCNKLIDLKSRIAEANCLGSGDSCEVLKMYYNPSEWSTTNQNFFRESVRNFYLYKDTDSCYDTGIDDPVQRKNSQDQASLLFNTDKARMCSVNDYEQTNKSIDLLRIAMRKILLATYDLTMIIANAFIMLFQAMWKESTAEIRRQIVYYFNHMVQMIKEALQEMGNLVVIMFINLVPFSKTLFDIFEALCIVLEFYIENIWNPVLCRFFKFVMITLLQIIMIIIDGIKLFVRINTPSEFQSVIDQMISLISKFDCSSTQLSCNFEWKLEEFIGSTAFLPSRCWANPISSYASIGVGASYLGCSGADTCYKDGYETVASNLILCESCPAVEGFSIEYVNRYGCDLLSKKCKCSIPVYSPEKCVQNSDCLSQDASCQLMIDENSPSYATLNCAKDCSGTLSAPLCYYDGTKPYGTCTCTTKNLQLQTCDQSGKITLPALSGMCLIEPNSALRGDQSQINTLTWQYSFLAMTPCINLNNAGNSQLCKRIEFPLNVIQYAIVGFELISLNINTARRRLMGWGGSLSQQEWFSQSMQENMLHYTDTWELAGEPCSSLAREYILMKREITSVTDKTTLQSCVFWKTVANETMNLYNISQPVKMAGGNDMVFVSLSGLWSNIQNPTILSLWLQNFNALTHAVLQNSMLQEIFEKLKLLYTVVDIQIDQRNKALILEADTIFRSKAANLSTNGSLENHKLNRSHMHPLFLMSRLDSRILPFVSLLNSNTTPGHNDTAPHEMQNEFTVVPIKKIPLHEHESNEMTHKRHLMQQAIQGVNSNTATTQSPYTTDSNAFVQSYALTWQGLQRAIFLSWSDDQGGYCKSGTAYAKLLVSAWDDTKTFYERGIPLRNNSKFDISANLRKFPPLDPAVQEKLRSSQNAIENNQNPDLITIALIWLSKSINSLIGVDVIGYVSFFTPSPGSDVNYDYITFENFLREMASCEFNRIQNCPDNRKNLLSSIVIVVLLVIAIISLFSAFFSLYIIPSILLTSFIPLIVLWYVYGVSPFCFPMLPTCLLRDFNDDFVSAFPATVAFPLSIIRNKTACNASGVPLNLEDCTTDPSCSARNFDRIYQAECFYKCTDNPFAFRSWQDTLAWYICDISPHDCESIIRNTFGPLYFFNDIITSAQRFSEVKLSSTPDLQQGYRVCSIVTSLFVLPGFFFVTWLVVMSFYILYFFLNCIINVVLYIFQIAFVNKKMVSNKFEDEKDESITKTSGDAKKSKKKKKIKETDAPLMPEERENEILVYSRRQVKKYFLFELCLYFSQDEPQGHWLPVDEVLPLQN